MTQFSYHGAGSHEDTCYCGRKATRHVSYGSGCGNVCGIHAKRDQAAQEGRVPGRRGTDSSVNRKGSGMNAPDAFVRWQPMKKAWPMPPKPEALESAKGNPAAMDELTRPREMAKNNLYTATVYRNDEGVINCLSIKRNDGGAVRDWRHMQQIKDELAGEDVDAFQIFPARKRIVDTANQTWLWCLPPGVVIPAGFPAGAIDGSEGAAFVGASQRDFQPGLGFGQKVKVKS
jgi:hypothetical protein